MKKIAIAVMASLAFASSAMAQTPAKVDPAMQLAINDLLASMNYDQVFKQTLAVMAEQMPANMLAGATAAINSSPKLNAEQKKKELEKLSQEMPKVVAALNELLSDPAIFQEMMAEMGPLYARHFTTDEVRQMAAFYRSPLGAKILTTMPAVVNESMALGQKVMIPRIQKMMQTLETK